MTKAAVQEAAAATVDSRMSGGSGEKTYIDLQRQALGQEKKKTTAPSFSR